MDCRDFFSRILHRTEHSQCLIPFSSPPFEGVEKISIKTPKKLLCGCRLEFQEDLTINLHYAEATLRPVEWLGRWRTESIDFKIGARLRGADLQGVELCGANLEKADLREAILLEASLLGARLGGASFREADLRGATLGGTDLQGGNLELADIRGAIFHPLP